MTRRNLFLLLSLLMAVSLAHARHEGAYLREVTTRLQTPHFDWATPYAQGKPKVLFITPRTIAPREIVELWQRFDLDFEAFTMAHSGMMSFESSAGAAPYDLAVEGTSIAEKTDELLAKLDRKYDAFVLANAQLDVLPKEAQYKLLKQVSEGAGLVFTFGRGTRLPIFKQPLTDQRDPILRGVPVGFSDYFQQEKIRTPLKVTSDADVPGKVVETYRFGKGRIAVLNYGAGQGTYYGGNGLTPPLKWSLNWAADYENLLSLVYKSLLWTTASRRPTVTFTDLPSEPQQYDRRALPATLSVGLNSDKPLSGKLIVIARDRTNVIEDTRELPLKLAAGDNAVPVSVPRLKAGEHYLDLILKSDKGTEQWGSVLVKVSAPLTLASFGLQSESVKKGQPAVLDAALSSPAPADSRLVVTLTDTNDRTYAVRNLAIEPGQTALKPLSLDLSAATTTSSHVRGELYVGKEIVHSADALLFVPRGESNLFRSVIWGVGGESGLTHLALKQLRAAGFTDHLNHPSPEGTGERLMAVNDLPLVCYAYRIMGHADEKGWRKDDWCKDVEDGCFYNPELQAAASKSVLTRIKNVIPYGPSLYSLGDENHYDNKGGYSPWGQKAFRVMLQRKYSDIRTLNSAWGTDYASFDAVELLPDEEARKRGLWPMIHEHLSFNEEEYADYHHFLRDEIRKADPGAWVGAEGSVPGDLEKTVAGMEIWGPYSDKRGNELLRSLVGQDVVRGNWWGGYVGSHGARAGATLLWQQLISGVVNTSLYFAATGAEGLLATDLSYADYFAKMRPDLEEIYGGIGQLISSSRVADDGIAVHWSQAGEHGSTLFAGVGSPAASQGNLLGLLDRSGFGYRYLTTSLIEGGALGKGVRVLFLPCSQALSDQEAKAITSFVEAGGVVIADVGTGNMTGVCRPLWKSADGDLREWRGQLDGLLGITRSGAPVSKSATTSLSLDLGKTKLSLSDFPVRGDSSVVATGATQVEGVPIFLTRTVGKGRVVFLNFPFPNPEHPDAVPFLRGLLAELGPQPVSHLTDSRGYTCRRFLNGGLTLIGIAREGTTARDTALKLATPAFVYDVRAGKCLGKLNSLALSTSGPANRIFALLSTAASAPTLKAEPGAKRGQSSTVSITFDKAGAPATGRWLRVQAFAPGGKEDTAYRNYLVLKASTTSTAIPWAFSDTPGSWTVRVTDVATGLSAAAPVKLQ
ncbi:MAG: beta-galactosidase [Armatimonadota bacterium]